MHLLFIDDTLIFSVGSHQDAMLLHSALFLFGRATGMQINIYKSTH